MGLIDDLTGRELFGNSVLGWASALLLVCALFTLLLALRRLVRRELKKLQATPETELLEVPLEVLARTTLPFFVIVSVAAGVSSLQLSPRIDRLLTTAITITLFWQAGVWIATAALSWLDRKRRRSLATDRAMAGSLGIIGFIVQGVIWAIVLLLTLDNLGVDITALVAGLGVGGIAVALAVQNILGDLFASLSITFDKPFVIGDFLIIDTFMGTVEHIGIKSTRLRSLSGEQIILSNAELLKSRLRNMGRMTERRVAFQIGVTYETPPEKLEQVPPLVRTLVESQPKTRFDRCHFLTYADSSLQFEIVYFVLAPEFAVYADIQQAINLGLMREFARLGIEFAYPTRRIVVSPPPSAAEPALTPAGTG
jgi:small-conductance mechanosensitive channel